ncbi:hypothetical protein CEXT_619391 [Caerostris extrusa]|uniref:Uncharacterized protein n=1 Tax=Caerostris extrusa TaxID=172846 RepID=A0AAV4Y8D5_CAEEX|nr:hypothetical protein CEXT_619391 [Caerostris extrusa]
MGPFPCLCVMPSHAMVAYAINSPKKKFEISGERERMQACSREEAEIKSERQFYDDIPFLQRDGSRGYEDSKGLKSLFPSGFYGPNDRQEVRICSYTTGQQDLDDQNATPYLSQSVSPIVSNRSLVMRALVKATVTKMITVLLYNTLKSLDG